MINMKCKMKNKIILGIIICVLIIEVIIFIKNPFNSNSKEKRDNVEETIQKENKVDNSNEVIKSVKILIDNKEYIIALEDNETAKEFITILPQEFKMSELNGNEKYVYLDTELKANSSNPKHINAGDVMLYGNNCLVIFYKSFDTTYSYTKIGHIDKLPDLGNGNIIVKIEK